MCFASASFVDFVSILNQYCQKSRINVPKYSEAPGVLGGFGAKVFVKGQTFTSMKYCGTKKEARHDAAKVALLGLNIPVGEFEKTWAGVLVIFSFHLIFNDPLHK